MTIGIIVDTILAGVDFSCLHDKVQPNYQADIRKTEIQHIYPI